MPLTVSFDEHGHIHFERHPFHDPAPLTPVLPPVEPVNPCERAHDPVDVAKLPSMPMEGRGADLPLLSAVYFVLAPCRECHVHHDVQYIGKAVTLAGRHRSTAHHRTTDFEAIEDARIAWMEVPKADLFDREQEMKDWFRPRLNDSPVPLDRQGRALLQVHLPPELVDVVREWAHGSDQTNSDMIAEMIVFWEQAQKHGQT
jgi:hypothetical protein